MAIEIQGLAPLLQVFDMPASIRFYRDVVGFEVAMTSSPGDDCDWVLLRMQGVELMLNTAYEPDSRPDSADPARARAHGDAALFFGCPDVDEAYRHFVAKGLDLGPPNVAPYGMKQLYLLDPDGYGLCFQWPEG